MQELLPKITYYLTSKKLNKMEKLKFSVDNRQYEIGEQFLTGLQIKELAQVPADHDLFLVVPGFDDELIRNEERVNMARPGIERFVSRKHGSGITLIVNGVPVSHSNPATTVDYDRVVKYAFPNAAYSPTVGYTVMYSSGPTQNPEGILVKGSSVATKSHMRFDVTATHRS